MNGGNGAYKFYLSMQRTTAAAELRGRIWEWQVHKYFRRVKPTTFQITSLDGRSATFDIEMQRVSPGTQRREVERRKSSYWT